MSIEDIFKTQWCYGFKLMLGHIDEFVWTKHVHGNKFENVTRHITEKYVC